MPVTEQASGTWTPGSISTTWSSISGPHTDDACVQLLVDLNNLVAGDIVEFRLLERVLTGGTARVVWTALAAGPQSEPVFASPALLFIHNWSLEGRQTAGTVRAFDWSLRKAA